jgi:uncharacterized protein (DUF885 family)
MSVMAAKQGFTQPCVTMTNFAETISGTISTDPAKSRFYAPFGGNKPATVSEADWATLQDRAKQIISGPINASYRDFGATYYRDIKAKCRTNVSVSAMPQGKEYYAFQVQQQTTTNLMPEEIHQIGLKEVARIRGEMEHVATKAGFASREAMIADMRTNPKWFTKSPEELMSAASRMAKIIDGQMPSLFGRLPRLPYGLKEIPLEIAPGSTRLINRAVPRRALPDLLRQHDQARPAPSLELPALTVHEAVPGHHMQIALQQELEMPRGARIPLTSPPSSRAGALFRAARSRWASTIRRKKTWGAWA